MNSHLLIPKIGLRFLLTGTPYEVSWTSQGVVRYSAIAGGKIYSISIEKFTEKYHTIRDKYQKKRRTKNWKKNMG